VNRRGAELDFDFGMIVKPFVDLVVEVLDSLVAVFGVEASQAAGAGAGDVRLALPVVLLVADVRAELDLAGDGIGIARNGSDPGIPRAGLFFDEFFDVFNQGDGLVGRRGRAVGAGAPGRTGCACIGRAGCMGWTGGRTGCCI
jgi:hypothetical protein